MVELSFCPSILTEETTDRMEIENEPEAPTEKAVL